MKVVLIGATGFVGSALLTEALGRGHMVTAIARNPDKLPPRGQLTVRTGDVYDAASLVPSLMGHDALISAFNPGWTDPHLYDDQIKGTSSIIVALKKARIKRVLWVGGAGGLKTRDGARVVDNPDFPPAIRPGSLATINAFEQLKNETELDWSYLAPSASMKSGQRTGHFRLGGDQLLVDTDGQSHISVQDFAVAMIDELEHPAHIRRRFTVGY